MGINIVPQKWNERDGHARAARVRRAGATHLPGGSEVRGEMKSASLNCGMKEGGRKGDVHIWSHALSEETKDEREAPSGRMQEKTGEHSG